MTTKLEAHGIHDLKEYHEAIRRSALPMAQKEKLLASPQIPTYDRGYQSPLGGLARKSSPGPFTLKRAEPMRSAVQNHIRDVERRKPR